MLRWYDKGPTKKRCSKGILELPRLLRIKRWFCDVKQNTISEQVFKIFGHCQKYGTNFSQKETRLCCHTIYVYQVFPYFFLRFFFIFMGCFSLHDVILKPKSIVSCIWLIDREMKNWKCVANEFCAIIDFRYETIFINQLMLLVRFRIVNIYHTIWVALSHRRKYSLSLLKIWSSMQVDAQTRPRMHR